MSIADLEAAMPVDVQYERDGTVIRLTGHGTVSDQEFLRAHYGLYQSDDRTRRYRGALSDWTRVEEIHVMTETVRIVAAMARRAARIGRPDAAVAIVAPKTVVFGLSRLWEAGVQESGLHTHVFEDLGEAERWLDEQLAAQDAVEPGTGD
jgi:hypothetical protein